MPGPRHRARASVIVLAGLAVLGLACQDMNAPSGGRRAQLPTSPSSQISDAAHGGSPHFYFLPPLVANPTYNGTFDGTQAPTITVCAWSGTSCGTVVAQFSMTDGTASQVIRVDAADQLYIVNWTTDECVTGACTLSSNQVYRIIVTAAKTTLGFADVYIVASQQQARQVNTGDYIPLVDGRTLPIKFRIEQGAFDVIPAITSSPTTVQLSPTGGVTGTADGAVALAIPAGAVQTNTAITINTVAVSSLPSSLQSPTLASSVYQFGPDGTTFAQPLTLTLGYKAPLGVAPTSLRVYGSSNGGPWVPAANRVLNLAAGTVSGTIRHFTNYTSMSGASVVAISPKDSSMSVGQQVQLTAALYDTAGAPITNQVPLWTSTDTTIAVVDSTGLVTGMAPGTVLIIASDGALDSAQVDVLAPTVNQWTVDFPGARTTSVWASSPSDVYAVTGDSLEHFDGWNWSQGACGWPCVSASFQSVWGVDSADVFAAFLQPPDTGAVAHRTGAIWNVDPMPFFTITARALWGTSPTDVYAAGDSAGTPMLLHYDSTWRVVQYPSWPVGSIGGTGPADVYAAPAYNGTGGDILHWDGSSWQSFSVSPLNSADPSQPIVVWGTSSDVFFAQGDSIVDYNPSATTSQCCLTAPVGPITAMWGVAGTDLFVGGSSGEIAHWDGTAWSVTTLNLGIHQIFGTSSTNVYVATDSGVYHGTFNGIAARRVGPTSPVTAARVLLSQGTVPPRMRRRATTRAWKK